MTDSSYPPPPPPPGASSGQPGTGPAWQAPGPAAPPAQGWQAPQYNEQAFGYAPGQGRWGPLAGWGSRVAAMLLDTLVQLIGMVPYFIGLGLFVAGAPDSTSRYDATTGTVTGATTDSGNVGLMVVG